MQAGTKFFVDTNVIIECFRLGVWTTLAAHHHLETVDKCVSEALTGDTSRPGRVPVDIDDLKNGLRADPHKVPKAMRNQLIAKHPSMSNLDDGEKDLYAYLFSLSPSLPGSFLVSTADKGQ